MCLDLDNKFNEAFPNFVQEEDGEPSSLNDVYFSASHMLGLSFYNK